MFGGIKSLVGDKKPVVAQPVVEEPLNLGSSNKSAFGLGTDFGKVRANIDAAKALRDAAVPVATSPAPIIPATPVAGVATLDTGATSTIAAPEPAPLWQYTGDKQNRRTQTDTQKINDILETWKSTGTLNPAQELDLQKLGKRYGTDFFSEYADFSQAAPGPKTVSEYVTPTTYEQNINQILGLTGVQENTLDQLTAKVYSGQTLTPKERNTLDTLLSQGRLGTYDEYFANKFAPTETNLFANLNYQQEQDLANLAQSYAAGEQLSNKQLNTLTSLLSTAGLGDIESYFAPVTYTAPTGYESMFGAGELTPESNIGDIIGQFNTFATQNDPVAAAQFARSLGLDEAEVNALYQGYGTTQQYGRPTLTMADINDIFTRGAQGLDDRVTDIFTATLGTDEEVKQVTDYINDKYNANLTPEDVRNMYSVQNIQDKSLEEITDLIQNSAYNRLQEANRFGGVLQRVFGYEDIAPIIRDVMSSEETAYDPEFRAIYQDLLGSNQMTEDIQDRILSTSARLTPDSTFWTDQYDDKGNLVHNGTMLFAAYNNPITEGVTKRYIDPKTGKDRRPGTGQYGYYNDAPILNADILKEGLGGKDSASVKNFYGKNIDLANQLGWDFSSNQDYTQVKQGLAAIGINTKVLNDQNIQAYESVMDKAAQYGNRTTTDPETGEIKYLVGYTTDLDGNQIPQYEAVNDSVAREITNLENKATSLGIDPTKFDSFEDLRDAMQAATQDIYLVAGQFTGGSRFAEEVADNEKTKGKNHAAVLYREINGKLIPVTEPTFFKYVKPKESWIRSTLGDFAGDIVEGLASIPFAPEIVLVASGGNAGLYASLKGLQTAAAPGSDVGDILKSAGMAYLSTKIIPDYVSPTVAQGIGSLDFVKDLPAGWQNFVTKTGTNAVIASGIAGLTNQDIGDAFLSSIISSTVKAGTKGLTSAVENSVIGEAFDNTKEEFSKVVEKLAESTGNEQFSLNNIPDKYKDLVSNILVDTMFGQDLDRAVQNNLFKFAVNDIKGTAATKNVVDKTQTKYEV